MHFHVGDRVRVTALQSHLQPRGQGAVIDIMSAVAGMGTAYIVKIDDGPESKYLEWMFDPEEKQLTLTIELTP